MIEYTPSTEDIWPSYVYDSDSPDEAVERKREFDRWLASERARTFDEGRALGADLQADGWNSERYDPQVHNPYLKGGDA